MPQSHAQAQIAEVKATLASVAQQLEESKTREAQARAHNKVGRYRRPVSIYARIHWCLLQTLREELRKVQSSAALLERQRNPGVGYWASRTESSADLRSPISSNSELPSTPRAESPTISKSEEEVNFEYLRNVILQFLEHKEMRVSEADAGRLNCAHLLRLQPHLVRILSTILRFTPQETRRLISKV